MAVLGLCLLTLPGCGPAEVLGRVEGLVTFEGKPVTEGIVVFANSQKGVYITADLNPQGEYLVDMAKGYGLPLGDYQVTVTPPLYVVPMEDQYRPSALREFPSIPEKYRHPETSGLTVTVTKEGNRYDIDMRP
jgi:hypothetical protein